MSFLTQPMFSIPSAGMCTVVSLFGTIVLAVFAFMFDNNYEAVMGSKKDPEDGHAVARTLYISALVYACLVVFCGCQTGLGARRSRGAISI
ncbi:hypothetical protein DACRYDRAFT_112861 [Dacryopinax primogenitus]|uniref:Uncharacterized protein n=1 Tax=Dacryopinax primogenitus (strain DJM 731) TaxID=1858805 RepID=M5GF99_DACPD|nr:uncharacterized protein DACRYDRAFT_112861 [Dacryopinax primogenitus]EJU06082.1 hypothetical protein DACRYDRAFT_112861 [Dacryopinax primogenitus]